MRPFETLEQLTTPEGRQLTLHRRDGDFFIHLDGEELMSTRVHGSETALAELACRELAGNQRPRVLIGGLGLGFTLRAALNVLPKGAEVVVAEIFGGVVEWNRRYLAELWRPLEDRRVRIVESDVAALVGDRYRNSWHAVLFDVDNSPSAFCLDSNARLYDRPGLERVRRSLVPGGVLAVWSAYADRAFEKRLRKSGFAIRTETVRARGRKGPRHTIFLAHKPGQSSRHTLPSEGIPDP